MNQRLVSLRFPYVQIRVELSGSDRIFDMQALVDTGFDGSLIMPESLLSTLDEPDFDATWRLADGSIVAAPTYRAVVEFTGLPGETSVLVSLLGSEAILGRGLTDRYLVSFDHGLRVIIEP